jgi:hypothetical protein
MLQFLQTVTSWHPPFWFQCLLSLSQPSRLRLPELFCYQVVKVGILVLFQILQEKMSTFNMMLTVRLSYTAFIMLRSVPCIHYLLRVVIMKGCRSLLNDNSEPIASFVLLCANVMDHVCWFVDTELYLSITQVNDCSICRYWVILEYNSGEWLF